MKEKEIIEGNKLIAEFMGGIYKISPITLEEDREKIYLGKDEEIFQINPRHERHSLKYNTSWNWLMGVVEKIGTDDELKRQIDISIEYFFSGDIHSVWLAVVELIKGHNHKI